MKFIIYERRRLADLETKYYIGATTCLRKRRYQHNKKYPGCTISVLLEFEVKTQDDADLIEGLFILLYRSNYGHDYVDNKSLIGNSSYKQDQAARSAALLGKTSGTRPCACIQDGKHHLFATQIAMAKFLGIPTNSVNDRLNDRLARFKTLRAKHLNLYYATDPRPDNAYTARNNEVFGY